MHKNLKQLALYIALVSLVSLSSLARCHNDLKVEERRGGANKLLSIRNSTTDLILNQQVTIPLNLNDLQLSSQINHSSNSVGSNEQIRVLIEVKVFSESLFQVFIREEGSFELDALQSIDGVHFYGFRNIKDRKVEVVLKNVEYLSNLNQILERSFTADFNNSLVYSIDILSTEQRVCPFDCFGNGFCQPNGQCLCTEGYTQFFHCQAPTSYSMISFEQNSRIFQQETQQVLASGDQGSQLGILNSNVDDWKYMSINLHYDEEIRKQVEQKYSNHQKPKSVSIVFQYQISPETSTHQLILLEFHKSYQILKSEWDSTTNMLKTVLEISYQDFDIKSLININSSYPLTVGHRGYSFIDISVIFHYRQSNSLFELFSLAFIIFFSLIFLYLFVLILKRHKSRCLSNDFQQVISLSLDQSEIQLNIEQVNAQIQSQMPTFNYSTPTNKNLNGTHYECFICLNRYQDLEECRMTKCGHVFHKDCVDAWLQKNLVCPVDRMNLSVKC